MLHAYTLYAPRDPDTVRRQRMAQVTWPQQGWQECPLRDEDLPRLWKEEGRQFPYIKDLFDFVCRGREPGDVVIYTNADIHCRPDCAQKIQEALATVQACYAYRRDFGRLDVPLHATQYARGQAYPGSDLSAFRVGWWRRFRGQLPDLLVGVEAWDPCYRLLVEQTNPGGVVCVRDIIGHERHASYWENPHNRYRLKSQLYARSTAANWLRQRGVDPRIHGL